MKSLQCLICQTVLLVSCFLVAIKSDCSVEIKSYSMSDSTTEGTLLLNSVPDALVWSGRTTAGMVLFALASDCTVSDSTDLTFSSETDLLSKITSFVQNQQLGTYIVGATFYKVLYDSIAVENLFRALGVHMFGTFDGTSFDLYSTSKNAQLFSDANNNDGTLLFITQKGSKHKALYKSFEGGQASTSLTATLALDYTCIPPLPEASLFQGSETTSDTNRRYSQQISETISSCNGQTMKGWQYIPKIDNSGGPNVNLYLLNTVTGAALVDTEINTSGQSTSSKTSMCLPTADQTAITTGIKYGLYYDSTTDGTSVIQALYPKFEGALTGQCGYESAVTDLDALKALDTASIFSNGGSDISRSFAAKPIFEPDFVQSCECTSDADCQTPGGDGHMICESSECDCESHYTYNPESNTCQFSLNPISVTTVTTSGVSEGTVEEIFDTDNSGDPDLSTSIALSATDNPWVVIDLGSETIINSVDISVPEVQFGAAELTCCGSDTFLYTFDHPDVVSNITCDITAVGNECTDLKLTGPYAWLLYDQINYEGSITLLENTAGNNVETHTLSLNPASIRRVDELGVLQSTTTPTCINVDGSNNAIMGACDMEVYFESDMIRHKTDGFVLNAASASDGATLSFSTTANLWKTEDKDTDGNTGIDTDDLAVGAYLELQSDSTLCLGLQTGSNTVLALRSKASNTNDCLTFKQKRNVPRLLSQQQEQFDITLDGDGDCTNDLKNFQNSYSYPACTVIEENSGAISAHVVYNSMSEVGFAATDQELWANCDGLSTQRLIYKADNPSLHDFVVGVSNTFSGTFLASDFTTCATYSGTIKNGATTTVQCDTPQKGRYLAINIPSPDTNEVIFLSNVGINGNKQLPVNSTCNTDTDCQSQGGGVNFVCLSNQCQCADGFEYQSASEACVDIDECDLDTDGCDQTCANTRGSFTCSCNEYCELNVNQRNCDCPTCSSNSGGCVNAACSETGTPGLVTCTCTIDGTSLDSDQKTCSNINECADDALHTCDDETTGLAQCSDLTPAADGDPKYVCDCGDEALITYNAGTATCEILDSVKTGGATANSLCSVNNGGCSDTCVPGANPLTITCSCPVGAHLLPDGLNCVVCEPAVKASCDADVNNLAFCTDDPNDANQDICVCQYSDLGISWNGTQCTTGANPDNLCSIENGLCDHTCVTGTQPDSVSPLLNFSCTCNSGYQLQSDGLSPDHVCTGTAHGCDTTCNPGQNIQDFTCSCNSGFALADNGKTCENVNECNDPTTCATVGMPVPECKDTVGSFTCDCGSGYTWDGSLCNNINECDTNKGGCQQNCQDLPGSFECSCGGGYTLDNDGLSCSDINECDTNNGGCGANTTCVNIPGSSECECVSNGYQFVQNSVTVCEDINECLTNNGGCNQVCTNTDGSFQCNCTEGYELSGDQLTCVNIDECALGIDECQHECRDLDPSFICECQAGYEVDPMNDKDCVDINECDAGQAGCEQNCKNTVGSFECSCNTGYNLNTDRRTCTPESECTGVTCVNGECSAIDSGYECICNSGYELSTTVTDTCLDINECNQDLCRANSQCQNSVGSFSCPCNVGYSAVSAASSCEDINECLDDPCSRRQVCTNTAGSYTCQCDSQYYENPAGQCTTRTISIAVLIVIQAPPPTSTLPSTQTFEEEGATPGSPTNLLLILMCVNMNSRAGFRVTCTVLAVRISSLATDFDIEFEPEEAKTAAEIALLPKMIYDNLETLEGDKVVTLGNDTIPLNDTGTVIGIQEYLTPDGRNVTSNDTEVIFGIDRSGSSTNEDQTVCSFFNVINFCLNGSSCTDNNGVPECSCLEGFTGEQCNEPIVETTTSSDKLSGTEIILISTFVPLFLIGAGILLFWIIYMALRKPSVPKGPMKYGYPHLRQSHERQPPPRRRNWWDEYSSSSAEAVESESRQERLSRWPAYRAYGIASRFPGAANYHGNGYYGNRY